MVQTGVGVNNNNINVEYDPEKTFDKLEIGFGAFQKLFNFSCEFKHFDKLFGCK